MSALERTYSNDGEEHHGKVTGNSKCMYTWRISTGGGRRYEEDREDEERRRMYMEDGVRTGRRAEEWEDEGRASPPPSPAW